MCTLAQFAIVSENGPFHSVVAFTSTLFAGDGHCQTLWIICRKNNNPIRARRPYKGQIMTRLHMLARVQWAKCHLIARRADWMTIPDLHLVMLMAELGFIAAQTSVICGLLRAEKRDRFRGDSSMVWDGMMVARRQTWLLCKAIWMLVVISTCVLMSYHFSITRVPTWQCKTPHRLDYTHRQFLAQNNVDVLPWPAVSPENHQIITLQDLQTTLT